MSLRKKKILGISGSTKINSTNLYLLKHISELYCDELDFHIYEGIDKLPHFSPGLDQNDLPVAVKEFRALIQQSDGILFCTPEYVFSLPGSLKNAIEWNVTTTVFSNKPVAMIVAAASGEMAYESLGLILTTIEAVLPEGSKLLIQGAKGKIDKDGIKDAAVKKRIREVISSLMESMNSENSTPTK